jgi:outer membrane receptor protein involved in Fe transport
VRTRRPDFRAPIQARFAGTLGGGVPEARGEAELSAGYGNGGILAGVRTREFDDYESPAGEVANSGWSDRGLRLRWDHGTGSAMWSIGWQSDQGRDIGRARSDSDVVRVTTPFEDSHRLTMSYQRESLAGFRRVRFEGMAGSIRQRTDQDRLATPNRARSVEQSEVGSRDVQVRATGERIVGAARVQIGADVDARYGLESTDTVVSYNLAGAAVSSLATPSIEHAHRTNAGMFTQIDMQAAPRLRLSGGLRGDVVHSANTGGYFGDREMTHAAVAGSAAVTVALVRSLSVTAQFSRGFREPMLSDRFYRGPVGRGFIEGNPDLEPETSRQIDVTARYDTGRLSLSGAFYDYRISNLIERYQSGTANFFYRNRGAARLRGVEAEARAALPLGFSISATGQFSRGRDDHDHTPIDDMPPESVSLVTRHRLGAVTSYFRVAQFASHTAAGPSEVPAPGYSLLDAGAAWRIHERLQVLGVMRNLLNDRFYSSAGPRWVYAPGRHGSVTILVEF